MRLDLKSESNLNDSDQVASTHTKNKVTLNIGSKNDPLKFYVLSPDNIGNLTTDMEVTEEEKEPLINT